MVETRRSSSSSKRPLSSPSSSPLPNGKRSKAAEASSSTNDTQFVPPAETLGTVKESEEQEARSSDLASDDGDKIPASDAAEPAGKTTPDVGEPLVSPMTLGDSAIDVEKPAKSNGAVLNRNKKHMLKSNLGVAW